VNPDDVVLNFNPGTLVILNVVLGLIMFGIALDTTLDDFKVVARKPKPFVIAILAQLIVLPAVTFALTLVLPVTPSMALGMILVACCPPGNISQVLTHRSGGNVALSVSMTAVSNIIYIFVLPLSIAFWGSLHPTARTLLEAVSLDAWAMLGDILLIIGLPFALGLFIRHRFPAFAKRVQPPRWRATGPISSHSSASSSSSSRSTTPSHWRSGTAPLSSAASAPASARR